MKACGSTLGVLGANTVNGQTLHGLAMGILMRRHVLVALGRMPRPLNEFELEPLLADLGSAHGNKCRGIDPDQAHAAPSRTAPANRNF